jgi:hypothetical protein
MPAWRGIGQIAERRILYAVADECAPHRRASGVHFGIIETVFGEVTPGAGKVCGLGHDGFETPEVGGEAAPQAGIVLYEEHFATGGQGSLGEHGKRMRFIRAKGSTQKLPDRGRGEVLVCDRGASRG